MATVELSGVLNSISGRLGGSVWRCGGNGVVVGLPPRGVGSVGAGGRPAGRRFGNIAGGWRGLTPGERLTWAVPQPPGTAPPGCTPSGRGSAFNNFVSVNMQFSKDPNQPLVRTAPRMERSPAVKPTYLWDNGVLYGIGVGRLLHFEEAVRWNVSQPYAADLESPVRRVFDEINMPFPAGFGSGPSASLDIQREEHWVVVQDGLDFPADLWMDVWFKPEVPLAPDPVFLVETPGTSFGFNFGGTNEFGWNGPSVGNFGVTPNFGDWNYAAVWFDNTNGVAKLWLNANRILPDQPYFGNPFSGTARFYRTAIAAPPQHVGFLSTVIVRLRELTDAEVFGEWLIGIGRTLPDAADVVGIWPMVISEGNHYAEMTGRSVMGVSAVDGIQALGKSPMPLIDTNGARLADLAVTCKTRVYFPDFLASAFHEKKEVRP